MYVLLIKQVVPMFVWEVHNISQGKPCKMPTSWLHANLEMTEKHHHQTALVHADQTLVQLTAEPRQVKWPWTSTNRGGILGPNNSTDAENRWSSLREVVVLSKALWPPMALCKLEGWCSIIPVSGVIQRMWHVTIKSNINPIEKLGFQSLSFCAFYLHGSDMIPGKLHCEKAMWIHIIYNAYRHTGTSTVKPVETEFDPSFGKQTNWLALTKINICELKNMFSKH